MIGTTRVRVTQKMKKIRKIDNVETEQDKQGQYWDDTLMTVIRIIT